MIESLILTVLYPFLPSPQHYTYERNTTDETYDHNRFEHILPVFSHFLPSPSLVSLRCSTLLSSFSLSLPSCGKLLECWACDFLHKGAHTHRHALCYSSIAPQPNTDADTASSLTENARAFHNKSEEESERLGPLLQVFARCVPQI